MKQIVTVTQPLYVIGPNTSSRTIIDPFEDEPPLMRSLRNAYYVKKSLDKLRS